MNKELKNGLIIGLFSSILSMAVTSVVFLGKNYFDEKNKKEQFAFDVYKKLYDESASKLKKVEKTYAALFSLYSGGFGLTSFEVTKEYHAFYEAISEYSRYISELERYGTNGQIKVAKNLEQWLYGIYSEFSTHFHDAQRVEKNVKKLLLLGDVNSEYFKAVDKRLESDIENLVRNENRIYYSISQGKKLVANSMEQYLNYQFRQAMDMQATGYMINAINQLSEVVKKSNEFRFEKKKLPFMFAEGRAFQTASLEFEGDTAFFERKNVFLKKNIKLKFLSTVIENDPLLQSNLKNRKTKEEKSSNKANS